MLRLKIFVRVKTFRRRPFAQLLPPCLPQQDQFLTYHRISPRNSKLTDTLLYDVMAGMDKLVNVTNLCFPNNVLTDECIDVLTKSITNKKIQELNLSNNKVGSEGGHK